MYISYLRDKHTQINAKTEKLQIYSKKAEVTGELAADQKTDDSK